MVTSSNDWKILEWNYMYKRYGWHEYLLRNCYFTGSYRWLASQTRSVKQIIEFTGVRVWSFNPHSRTSCHSCNRTRTPLFVIFFTIFFLYCRMLNEVREVKTYLHVYILVIKKVALLHSAGELCLYCVWV